MDEATILHADLDSFYASVEQRDDPALRGRPVIVGGGGVVLAATYEAKAFGVRTAMNARQARALCPKAVFVPARMDAYSQASEAVFDVFRDTTPLVEPMSIDEAFLDVGGLRRIAGTPEQIGQRLRERVRAEVGLPITVGIARTKFLAKVASGVAKPDGLLVVEPDHELAFLHPLPVEKLWGVGSKTAEKLRSRGIATVGDVAQRSEEGLVALLGRAAGGHLFSLSRNVDPRPIDTGRRRRSVGAQSALGSRPKTFEQIDARLVALVDRVASRLRAGGRVARTVVLRLRFNDFEAVTRSHTLPQATDRTDALLSASRDLLMAARPLIDERGCTLVGIAASNLEDSEAVQLGLPMHKSDETDLDGTLDDIHRRFGSKAVVRGVHVGTDPHRSVPLLPD